MNFLQIVAHHFRNQLRKRGLRLPAEDFLRLFGISQQRIHLGRAEKFGIHRHDDAPKATKKNRGLGPRIAIVMLLATFCYAFATIVFVYNSVIHKDTVWLAYIWAVPASLSFAVFFSRRWWSGIVTLILVSLDMWSILAGFYLHFLATVNENIWPIFLLGVPVQIIFVLFEYIRRRNARL